MLPESALSFALMISLSGSPAKASLQDSLEEQAKDVDPYFVDSSAMTSRVGPQVITRNILQDSKGEFWLATWNGILRFDGITYTNVTNQEGLRRYRAFTLLEDRDQNIWIGTCGAGVYRYDGSTYTNLTTEDGLVDDVVLSIMQDKDGNLWFGGMGATKYDGKTFTSFSKEDGFTSSDVNSISEAPDGSIWFGTRGALFHYDGESFVNFTKEHGLNISSYIPTLIDHNGHLWFGGQNGIFHYDGETLEHPFHFTSFSLMEDSQGMIWFSGGGLNGAEPQPGTTVLNRFDPTDGLENMRSTSEQFEVNAGMVFGMMEDADGVIWFGTGGGERRIEN